MRKLRQNHQAQEKVFILKRHLIDRVPVSDLCDESKCRMHGMLAETKKSVSKGKILFTQTCITGYLQIDMAFNPRVREGHNIQCHYRKIHPVMTVSPDRSTPPSCFPTKMSC
jgi:hypothetical protein